MIQWLRVAAVVVVLSAGLGGAEAQTAPQAPPVKGAARQTPVPAKVLPVLPADPELTPQADDTTKRITGYAGDPRVDGATCRTGCAQTYYTCLSNNEDSTPCGQNWAQCLKGCPAHSSAF